MLAIHMHAGVAVKVALDRHPNADGSTRVGQIGTLARLGSGLASDVALVAFPDGSTQAFFAKDLIELGEAQDAQQVVDTATLALLRQTAALLALSAEEICAPWEQTHLDYTVDYEQQRLELLAEINAALARHGGEGGSIA